MLVETSDSKKVSFPRTFAYHFLTVDLTSSSTCCEMTLSCADRLVTFVNPSPNDWCTLGNHFATDRRLVGDKAPIDHRLIADQSQIGRRYIAKIPHSFRGETDRRTVGDRSASNIRPL